MAPTRADPKRVAETREAATRYTEANTLLKQLTTGKRVAGRHWDTHGLVPDADKLLEHANKAALLNEAGGYVRKAQGKATKTLCNGRLTHV